VYKTEGIKHIVADMKKKYLFIEFDH